MQNDNLTSKRAETINAGYSLENRVLQIDDKNIYLGEIVTEDLRWNTHVSTTYTEDVRKK